MQLNAPSPFCARRSLRVVTWIRGRAGGSVHKIGRPQISTHTRLHASELRELAIPAKSGVGERRETRTPRLSTRRERIGQLILSVDKAPDRRLFIPDPGNDLPNHPKGWLTKPVMRNWQTDGMKMDGSRPKQPQ